MAEETRQSFGEAVQISLKASETELKADGEDIVFIEISMKDKEGYPVENANNYVRLKWKVQVHWLELTMETVQIR